MVKEKNMYVVPRGFRGNVYGGPRAGDTKRNTILNYVVILDFNDGGVDVLRFQ